MPHLPAEKAKLVKDLQQRYQRELQQLIADLMDGKGADQERFAEVERIAKIVGFGQVVSAQARIRRWPIVACAIVTLGLITVLVSSHVSTAEIELEATANGVSFTLASTPPPPLETPRPLIDHLVLRDLEAHGLNSLGAAFLTKSLAPLPASSAHIAALPPAGQGSLTDQPEITLETLDASAGSRVILSQRGKAGEFRMVVSQAKPLDVIVSVRGKIEASGSGAAGKFDAATDPKTSESLRLHSAGKAFLAEFSVSPGVNFHLLPSIHVSELGLSQPEAVYELQSKGPPRDVSTLLSGKVYLEALAKEITLRDFDLLQFDSASGVIRSVTVSPGALANGSGVSPLRIRFHGLVKGMRVGALTETSHSLMPTWIEWLAAQRSAVLMWSCFVYVAAMLMSIFKWLRIEQ